MHATQYTSHNIQCTLHATRYMHTAHHTLHIVCQRNSKVHITQYTLVTTHYTLDTVRTQRTTRCTLSPRHILTYCTRHATHYLIYDALFTTPYTTHATHSTLHATCCTVRAMQCLQNCERNYCFWKLSRLFRDCSLAGVP